MSQGSQKSPEELRANIERTRRELGETVEALAQKADITTQAKERIEEMKSQARDNPAPVATGIGVALIALWMMRRRR